MNRPPYFDDLSPNATGLIAEDVSDQIMNFLISELMIVFPDVK